MLVDGHSVLPEPLVHTLQSEGYAIRSADSFADALTQLRQAPSDAAMLVAPRSTSSNGDGESTDDTEFKALLRACEIQGTATTVFTAEQLDYEIESPHLVSTAHPGMSIEEIRGRLAMVAHYHRMARSMERDLDNMQRLFRQLNLQFTEVDQEMRLAGRLQNAFLPHELKPIEDISFAALYRPATFVSGDIYDVYRVDEDHVAFYVADAVGHGMAASLLTMFIKNAVTSKVVHDEGYEVLNPDRTLQRLNRRLVEQQLPNSQFVTACLGLLNLRTKELQVARAGHPYPLHCTADGALSEMKSPGGLLGLFEEEEFPVSRVTLRPGEKLILYSDGVELAFADTGGEIDHMNYYHEAFRSLADQSAERFVTEFAKLIDSEAGSLNPQDDVTLLVLEVAK